MTLSIIVAVAGNGVIGREGALPWKLSLDLRRFRQLTMGHHLIMGRKTFDSIGRPLPGRTSIVLTRDANYRVPDGVLIARDLPQACQLAAGDAESFVIGGAEIYRLAWPACQRVYLTRVLAEVPGDTRLDLSELSSPALWRRSTQEHHADDDKNEYPTQYEIYDRATM